MPMTIAVCHVCEGQIHSISNLAYQSKRGRDNKKWYYFNIATSPSKAGGLFASTWKSLQRHGWRASGDMLSCPCR